ncbi:hypothetical protein Nepgr_008171 [Nepenthes gracilis]|uniref:Uncharacterized protein n=1 Tax=Nepenthes gracilis TaxID=150966 RepID=A0AAD3XJ71_NEPGR|nr:hypothetical protein Nepgr_008171 [Nepenthes gracilis]
MSQAINKVVRSASPSSVYAYEVGRRTGDRAGLVRFAQVAAGDSKTPGKFDNGFDGMDNAVSKSPPTEETGDAMSRSFGEAYATRCQEEGFGGIYGGNDTEYIESDRVIHKNYPAFDKCQRSEVKEAEKARHQKSAD